MTLGDTIFSIGHSTHSLESFLTTLRQQHIEVVCDVRSQPYSRVTPHFSRETFQHELKKRGFGYIFLGNELGARSNDPSLYANGKISYDKLASSDPFQRGLREVRAIASTSSATLMCAEREPLACHRTILVSRHLWDIGLRVTHILGTGALESHEDSMLRLLRILGLHNIDMFRSHDEVLKEAYAIQGLRIAYDPTKHMSQPRFVKDATR